MRLLPVTTMLAAALVLLPAAAAENRQRLIVLSDLEADPDDSQSLVRLLLYSNQIDIEALVATTSTHQKTRIAPESMRAIIAAYGKVQANLSKHEAGYPKAAALKSLVREGLPVYGMQGVGEGKDSAGSEAIIKALEKHDQRPLWISVWGGANTLAQALYRMRHDRTPAELARMIGKLRVYAISDQDDTGIWIRTQFPQLFYIVSPGGYGAATWGGMHVAEPGFDNTEVGNSWIAEHIQQGHGPLGAAYPDVGYGAEGDTPAFLSLIPNGLNAPEHPDWGGWGGRYELYIPALENTDPKGFNGNVPVTQESRPIWTNASDSYAPMVFNEYGRNVRAHDKTASGFKTTIWRWRKEFQNDFAARMDWTTKPYSAANHPPVARLGHAAQLTVRSGEEFMLSAAGSTDPDGDSLSYLWFHYPEAGSYKTPLKLNSAENLAAVWITAPKVDQAETAHFVVKVTDKGKPALTRYQRVVVTFVPAS
ncbi:DUF1593 domain-containing protein [Duganella radicis]|uniref:DUF1593 domain-containing protein n=1 Tax=Duganella radicis TaxID=551988 RepID=A0A6L6PTP0_9BURK|nr:DUF1593 domain-containing protein [Duganella radicis]MTV41615.1 DUF1593 domain-containing protein [Duganella radicis]